jgi:hypothetical protein
MRILSAVVLSVCVAMVLGMVVPKAKASEWDKKTVVTFNEPVEIPGKVLAPGTYIFSLSQTLSDRHIVQIWSGDGEHLIAAVITDPIERDQPAPEVIVQLEKRGGHTPEAIKDWFYPGDLQGEEFFYPAPAETANRALGR